MKRKTPLQLQILEDFYTEENYPTQEAMQSYASALGLTSKQVRGWFIERRRRDKRDNETDRSKTKTLSSRYECTSTRKESSINKRAEKIILQDLLTPGYILKKLFRKDGPPLGVQFDSLPSKVFHQNMDSRNSQASYEEKQRAKKRRKVSKKNLLDCQDCNEKAAGKKHGMGKGLMTVWRAVNPNGGDPPPGFGWSSKQNTDLLQISTPILPKPPLRKKRPRQLASILKQKRLENKLREKRKPPIKRREVGFDKDSLNLSCKEKCELALDGEVRNFCQDQSAMLVDDEELEMRELRAGPNPLTCSDHLGASGLRGCSLCRDFLAKFPPNNIKMKQPFGLQPWDSSPETVKKLFKVFHFLYTYSLILGVCPFTLDEFAQAFHDKDSLLLGKIHVALLKLLLLDVEMGLSSGIFPNLSVSCKFLALLHSVENQELILEFWKKSLNPLTWIEILRQVLVAAGFGSKQGLRKECLSKEMNLMAKCGLRPGTLKGELFRSLSEQGSSGLNVSDLAKDSKIAELNLASSTEELERLICSTLSSDITLFEKISQSAYRLRINSLASEASDSQSDDEDSGSVDDNSDDGGLLSNSSDSECDSETLSLSKPRRRSCRKSKNVLSVYTEIDESHPGEAWLLGLMEGEYADLSIEEKLSALVALVDLLVAGLTLRTEEPRKAIIECIPSIHQRGSGAKIKRLSSNQHNFPRPSWVHVGQIQSVKEAYPSSECHPIDSSSILKISGMQKSSSSGIFEKDAEVVFDVHPMQSIFLGSDRRYNRYWLFLGPCNAYDPGHKRVYFESSEDGHWEVIDTEEALRTLLSVLDDRGAREALLIESLEKREAFLCQAMSSSLINDAGVRQLPHSDSSELEVVREDSSSPVSDIDNLSLNEVANNSLPPRGAIILEVGKRGEEQNRVWSRLQKFDAWIWEGFYLNLNAVKHSKRSYLDSLARCESCHDLFWRDEKHCKICHTTFELDFDLEERYAVHAATCRKKGDNTIFPKHKVLSSQLQSLKAAVHAIESVMPEEALVGAWTKSAHRLWVKRLRRTSSLSELLQVVADFVGAFNEDWLWQCNDDEGFGGMEEIIKSFQTMPQTSSAVAFWLVKLDDLIHPYMKKLPSLQSQETRTKGTGRNIAKA